MTSGLNGSQAILRNFAHLLTKDLVVYLLRFLYVTMCARLLGPELYGLLVYGQTWYLLFFPLALMGLQSAISRVVGRDRRKAREVLTHTLHLRVIASLIAAVLCVCTGWLISDTDNARNLILVFSFALAGRSLAQWTNEVFNAYESSYQTLRQETLFRVCELVLGLFVLLAGGGVIELAAVHGMVWWLQAARGFYIVSREHTSFLGRFSLSALKPVLALTTPFLVSGLLVNWERQGAIIMFRHVSEDSPAAGEFSLAIQIMLVLSSAVYSLGITALPVLSRSAARRDGKELLWVDFLVRGSALLAAGMAICAMVLGPVLIPVLFSERYAVAAELLGPAIWCLLPLSVSSAVSVCAVARGYIYLSPVCHLVGAAALTLSLPALVSEWGPFGGVAATWIGLASAAACFVTVAVKRKWLKLIPSVIAPLLTVTASVLVFTLLRPFSAWWALAASLASLTVIAIFGGVVTKTDRDYIRQVFLKRS